MEYKRENSLFCDSKTMLIRNLKISFRSPGAIALSLFMPASMLIVFVYVFGGAMDVGDISFINYIVPGVVLLTIGQFAPAASVKLNDDISKGVIDRFHTMPIAKSSILIGHVLATIIQNIVTVCITICTSLLVGFRPQASVYDWLITMGIILLYIIMMMWMAVLSGLLAKTPESASGLMTLVGVLPFLSSAFVPTETMPHALRFFSENQPMTPIVNSVRSLLLNEPLTEGTIRLALLWCISLGLLCYVVALKVYKRKTIG